ncbi:hypothetical protein PBI_SCTP2_85 [Salicola phage SCTP-2]|nr:hypothetical protein PBI_SCTP2_85 [Salicola phage SCTP-2]
MGKRKNKQNKSNNKNKNQNIQNFVAKHAKKVNKAEPFTDRKKAMKKGYSKHKKSPKNGDFFIMAYHVDFHMLFDKLNSI